MKTYMTCGILSNGLAWLIGIPEEKKVRTEWKKYLKK